MERFLILLMMVPGLLLCPVVAQDGTPAEDAAKQSGADAAELRESRREAAAYVKEELRRNKKLTLLLKKVKDAKSAKKQAEKILELTGNGKKKKTALGEAAPAKIPAGPAMAEERKKHARELKASYAKLRKQVELFNEIEISDCQEYDEIRTAIEALPGLSEPEMELEEE